MYEIIVNDEKSKTFFELDIEQCFEYRGRFYIKTSGYDEENAFCLSSATVCSFTEKSAIVRKCKISMVVEYE